MYLETKRLIIKPSVTDDVEALHQILQDDITMRFFIEGPYTKEKVEEFINRNQKEVHHYSVFLKSSNRLIGKLSYNPWFAYKTKEIGWIFLRTATNNGYCTEAAQELIDYAFQVDNVHRIVATCDPNNLPSRRVMEKLMMTQEAHFKKCLHYKDDIWWDEVHYSLLEEDYFKE